MLYREIFRIMGYFFFLFSFALIFPLAVAIYYQFFSGPVPQAHTALDFLLTLCICILLGGIFLWLGRGATGVLYRREGIAAVVIIWFLTPAVSAIPFMTSGVLTNPFQAYFEMVSGFTTTGATVLQAKKYNELGEEIPIVKTFRGVRDTTYIYYGTVAPFRDPVTGEVVREGVEALGKGLLFWRSFTHWLGGMGIVVLFVAILPALGVGGKMLFQSEVSGPIKEGATPRIKEAALQLWKIYMGLTVLQIAALLFFNPELSIFEAVNISFATISTGGFTTQNTSIAGYHSVSVEWIVTLFMFLGGVNFTLYLFLIKGKFYRLIDTEFVLYIIIVLFFCYLVVTSIYNTSQVNLLGNEHGPFNWHDAIRYGVFQTVSAQTSTGFATTDYDFWPYSAQIILLIAMFIGGMSGSTSGGMKVIRQYMLFRIAQYRVESLFRPEHLRIFKIGDREVDYGTSVTVLCFFLIVISISVLGAVFYVFDGLDLETAISMTTALQNNTGFGFRMAGPEYSAAFLSNFSLTVGSLQMLFGRLEYYALLAVLVPAFWEQDT